MNKVSITHINNSHGDWLRSLDFYKQELGVLKGRLTEVAGKNSAPDVMKQVEHYENQFKVQAENIDTLAHEIKTNIASIGKEAQASSAGYVDSSLLAHHNTLGQRFDTEEKTVKDLRHSFMTFASEWM